MRRTLFLCVFAIASASAHAQAINVWPSPAPGSEHWTQKETTYENTPIGTVVINVVTPTLTAYLPDREKATGAGVIIVPGGAFVAVAIDLEGHRVARWLQERGVAAFVLKYRILEKRGEGIPKIADMDAAARYGIADAIQAIKIVRQHANEWHVSAGCIGVLGFSAGAMIAGATALQPDAAARPDFAALIYGAPFGAMPQIPAKLPPLFLAWADDDPMAKEAMVRFSDALRTGGHKPEIHIYSAGGHGFGMKKQGTASDHWIDDYYQWLETRGSSDSHVSRSR